MGTHASGFLGAACVRLYLLSKYIRLEQVEGEAHIERKKYA